MVKTDTIVEERVKAGFDAGELSKIIEKVLEDNPQSVEDYLSCAAMGYLVGQTMRATRGNQMVNKIKRRFTGLKRERITLPLTQYT